MCSCSSSFTNKNWPHLDRNRFQGKISGCTPKKKYILTQKFEQNQSVLKPIWWKISGQKILSKYFSSSFFKEICQH